MRVRSACPVRGVLSVGAAVFVMGCGASPSPGATQAIGSAAVDPVSDVTDRPGGQDADGAVQSLRLDDMDTERADPTSDRRNPFRFGAARPSPSLAASPVTAPSPPAVRSDRLTRDDVPVVIPSRGVPASSSAIPLTFMGFMESPGVEGRVVVLSDGDDVFHGRRGDVIDGRYRILTMGLESVELERIAGRGRATLRLPNDPPGGL
ncbi:MAG: hypothetical protein OSB03_18975 [Vicinamibacterales bacterium]|nr:hypothetical protein [Vicinamibacterales bacterium]